MLKGSIAAVLALLAIASAPDALASGLPKVAFDGAIELPATGGYKVTGLVFSTGTEGGVTLFVSDGKAVAIYSARGTGTANSADVDLGALGRVDVELRPTGGEETVHRGCEGQGEAISVPGYELAGTVEFHGEEGFAEASATRTPLLIEPLLNLVCGGLTIGETSGQGLPGVELTARSATGTKLTLQQNHPGGKVFYEATEREKEGAVEVERIADGHLGAGAFRYAPSLASASFSAASPFSGAATYSQRTPPHEVRPGHGSWRGSLSVDFPGDADARLAGPGFKASIIHSYRSETHR